MLLVNLFCPLESFITTRFIWFLSRELFSFFLIFFPPSLLAVFDARPFFGTTLVSNNFIKAICLTVLYHFPFVRSQTLWQVFGQDAKLCVMIIPCAEKPLRERGFFFIGDAQSHDTESKKGHSSMIKSLISIVFRAGGKPKTVLREEILSAQ